MKIFKQKYKTPTKEEFPPIISYHDKRYGGTMVDEQAKISEQTRGDVGQALLTGIGK